MLAQGRTAQQSAGAALPGAGLFRRALRANPDVMTTDPKSPPPTTEAAPQPAKTPEPSVATVPEKPKELAKEFGGPKGPEPTRYGDWERKGRCVDF